MKDYMVNRMKRLNLFLAVTRIEGTGGIAEY